MINKELKPWTIYAKSTLPEARLCSDYASEMFYHFLDLRYSILKQFLQINNIAEKIWSFIFKNNFESTINVKEYVLNIIIRIDKSNSIFHWGTTSSWFGLKEASKMNSLRSIAW